MTHRSPCIVFSFSGGNVMWMQMTAKQFVQDDCTDGQVMVKSKCNTGLYLSVMDMLPGCCYLVPIFYNVYQNLFV